MLITSIGPVQHYVEFIGESNRDSNVHFKPGNTRKTGDIKAEDVNEISSLVDQVRSFPSHPSKDIYGLDYKLEFDRSSLQWSNEEDKPTANELGENTKRTFKIVVDSLEAVARRFATNDAAI